MTDFDANARDADYLACQLHTNGVLLMMKARMQKARTVIHDILVEIAEEEALEPSEIEIPLPHVDTSRSRPRQISGPVERAHAGPGSLIDSDPPGLGQVFLLPRR